MGLGLAISADHYSFIFRVASFSTLLIYILTRIIYLTETDNFQN